MAAVQATKGTLLELTMLALANSSLAEMGLDAIRSLLKGDPRLGLIGGAFNLQPVWDLFESQEGFDPEAARAPFCFIKLLEPKLGGITITFPKQLESLTAGERTRYAATCPAKREDVERIIANPITDGVTGGSARRVTKPPTEAQPDGAQWNPTPKGGKRPKIPRMVQLVGSAVVGLGSIIFLVVWLIINGDHTPTFSKMDTDFAAGIPLASAEKWASEVHAALSNPGWMQSPEAERRRQMENALTQLATKNLTTLIVEDGSKQIRASAQFMNVGKPDRAIMVRFY